METRPNTIFRRRIQLHALHNTTGGVVRAALEDDFHHFLLELKYKHGEVAEIRAEAPRHPYSVCPGAVGPLEALIGMHLDPIANAVTRHSNASLQCTHLFDLAGLAIALAARGDKWRTYDIEVPRHVAGRTRATLLRDDGWRLEWWVHEEQIEAPQSYAGVNLRQGMARWVLSTLPQDEAEAALVLRRCALIALGRLRDVDADAHAHATGRCYAQQPERAERALRIIGSTQDFSARPETLCSADVVWLHQSSRRHDVSDS